MKNWSVKILFALTTLLTCGFVFGFQSSTTAVEDPYIWLEEMDSAETKEWIEEQNRLTNRYFDSHPVLEQIKDNLSEISNLDQMGIPEKIGDRLFYLMQKKGENQSVLVVQEPNGERIPLVDPNLINAAGNTSLTGYVVSENGKTITYGLSESGSDQHTWYFLDLESGEKLSDKLEGIRFSMPTWSKEDLGVYYIRFAENSNTEQRIYYHRLGTNQHDDLLIYSTKNQSGLLLGWIEPILDGSYLMLTLYQGCDKNNGIYLFDLETHKTSKLFAPGIAHYTFIKDFDGKLYFVTSHEVKKNQVIAVNPNEKDKIEVIIPEQQNVLHHAVMANNTLVCSYFDDCQSKIKLFDIDGHFKHEVDLPHPGTVYVSESDTDTFYFSFMNFVTPNTIYQHYIEENKTERFFQPEMSWNTQEYITTQIFFPSKDGTKIPMFITHKKGIDINGEVPTLMYGYGGFHIPITPNFSPLNLAWLEMGGIYASVCLRGGGEYGPEWHEAGRLHQKQNVFDDFIAAGEWLIDNGYTQPKNLAITGRSNGGLLVGACLVQRPDLFGAAVPQVGVLDMLRFHKFSIGWAWMSDYGNPDNQDDYEYLLTYSPYHNIFDGENYPATLITTADHDDRVVPLHSYKFAAKLQEAQNGTQPILLRVYSETGHGAGRSTMQELNEFAEILFFLKKELF